LKNWQYCDGIYDDRPARSKHSFDQRDGTTFFANTTFPVIMAAGCLEHRQPATALSPLAIGTSPTGTCPFRPKL